jgi:hypothetical protein
MSGVGLPNPAVRRQPGAEDSPPGRVNDENVDHDALPDGAPWRGEDKARRRRPRQRFDIGTTTKIGA